VVHAQDEQGQKFRSIISRGQQQEGGHFVVQIKQRGASEALQEGDSSQQQ